MLLLFIGISEKRGAGGHAENMLAAAGEDVSLVLCGSAPCSSELGVL